ncbi:putative acyl-CoA transferase/carnitine dehydratase [uncultured delta proteobacterium]|uniref:Putative acyl-CoA transferase/carnitine dehydratase n=1 Tax=uncultured delta proteobacterium TaxID=34034 RepID=A0A212KD98_9DELT|nr:putative acyl-CoA transferase/carnitine dehydratase [uncultured delta proteobacterium]
MKRPNKDTAMEPNTLPLRDITVIDAATMLAAPWSAAFLADYGANVIKVEHPEKGDTGRAYGKQKNGVGLLWKSMARNKRCITLNLGKPEGQEIFKKLAAKADVVIENYRPGTLEKWNIGYEQLAAVNPSLVMLRTTGFGQTGPYASRGGFGTVAEAMSGFASINGAKGGPPTLPGLALADGVCGIFGALSVMIALHERNNNPERRGQSIDISLYEPLMRLVEPHILSFDQLGLIAERVGNASVSVAPRNAYVTKDGTWVALSGAAQPIAANVFKAVGRPELIEDERFCNNAARMKNVEELDAIIGGWIRERDWQEVQRVFSECGAVIGPMYTMDQLFEDNHYKIRESFVSVEDEELGSVRMPNVVAKFSRTPGKVMTAGAPKGKHNEEVYSGMLGIPPAELARLHDKGVV